MKAPGTDGESRRSDRFISRCCALVISLVLLAGGLGSNKPAAAAHLVINQKTVDPEPSATAVAAAADTPLADQQLYRDIARLEQEKFRRRLEVPAAVAPIVSENKDPQSAGVQTGLRHTSNTFDFWNLLVSTIIVCVYVGAIFREEFQEITGSLELFRQGSHTLPSLVDLSAKVRAEEESIATFLTNFKINDQVLSATPTAAPVTPDQDFIVRATECLAAVRTLLQEASLADPIARQKALADCHRQLGGLNTDAGLAKRVSMRQLTGGLEGLLKQVAGNVKYYTASTLRTINDGVELLAELAQPGQPADLADGTAVRLLVVDDDSISRNALAFALRRVFPSPDLATGGKPALALAEAKRYDLIFLDVMMPEMDGFELCSRLRVTDTNGTTPVVFVTCMDDYDSRARAVEVGGMDLIGKPFLTFEIIVKALTLIYGNRLRESKPIPQPVEISSRKSPAKGLPATVLPPAVSRPGILSQETSDGSPERPDDTMTTALVGHISNNLATLQAMLKKLEIESEPDEAQADRMLDFYMLFHALAGNIELAGLRAASELSDAVETLIKRLIEKPGYRTPSTAHTIYAAMNLLVELCGGQGVESSSERPVRLLVLDPDVTTRRVVIGALQTVFEKPDSAEDADAALSLMREKNYDVAFLGLQLSGTDGLELGLKMRSTPATSHLPLVFLVGEETYAAAAGSLRDDGMEVIAKPILPVEIKVKTLTLAFRQRALLTNSPVC